MGNNASMMQEQHTAAGLTASSIHAAFKLITCGVAVCAVVWQQMAYSCLLPLPETRPATDSVYSLS